MDFHRREGGRRKKAESKRGKLSGILSSGEEALATGKEIQ